MAAAIPARDRAGGHGLQKLSRGRVTLLDLAGLPNLMLTVRGRKSGIERSTPLLYVPYRGTYLVAGS